MILYNCDFGDFLLIWTKNNKNEHFYPGDDMLFFNSKKKAIEYIQNKINNNYIVKEITTKQLLFGINDYIKKLELLK